MSISTLKEIKECYLRVSYGISSEAWVKFDLSIGADTAPVKSWGGKEVNNRLYFKISNLASSNVWGTKITSFKVKSTQKRAIQKNNSNDTFSDYMELLKDTNTLKDDEWIEIKRKNEEDYGLNSLTFLMKWYNQEHEKTFEEIIGYFSYLGTYSETILNPSINNLYSPNRCYYVDSSKSDMRFPVLFFEEKIEIQGYLELDAKQLCAPRKEIKKEIELFNFTDINRNKKEEIEFIISENYFPLYGNHIDAEAYAFDAKATINLETSFNELYSLEAEKYLIEPIQLTSSFLENSDTILIPFLKQGNIFWEIYSYSYYREFNVKMEIRGKAEWFYKCPGKFEFTNASSEQINELEYFFKGLGFYYNFEKGITQNQEYHNQPCCFYLFQSNQLTSEEKNELNNRFFRRTPLAGEEEIEENLTKKKNSNNFSILRTTTTSLFNNSQGISFKIDIDLDTNKEDIYTDHFFSERIDNNKITLYTSETMVVWFKEGEITEQTVNFQKNQDLEPQIIYRDLDNSINPIIDEVALITQFSSLKTYSALSGSSKWRNSVVVSDFSITLMERDSITKQEKKRTPITKDEIVGGENYDTLLQAFEKSYEVILNNFVPNSERTYSLLFTITLENFILKKTFENECCFWVPFEYYFSTERVMKEYEPQWVEKVYSSSDYNTGLFRKNNSEEEVPSRKLETLSLQEGDIYYKCQDVLGRNSAFYDQTKNIFYGNSISVPFRCNIKGNSFFSKKGKDGEYNFNKLLTILRDQYNQNLISFPSVGGYFIEYKQSDKIEQGEWIETKKIFSSRETNGSSIATKDLGYTFPDNINSPEEFKKDFYFEGFMSTPFTLNLEGINPSQPLFFRTDLRHVPFYAEWSYPPLGKIPTIAYRKNRLGINSLKINDREDHILIMEQKGENESRYVSIYNHLGELTLQIDLFTGNYYFGGQQSDTPLIET